MTFLSSGRDLNASMIWESKKNKKLLHLHWKINSHWLVNNEVIWFEIFACMFCSVRWCLDCWVGLFESLHGLFRFFLILQKVLSFKISCYYICLLPFCMCVIGGDTGIGSSFLLPSLSLIWRIIFLSFLCVCVPSILLFIFSLIIF